MIVRALAYLGIVLGVPYITQAFTLQELQDTFSLTLLSVIGFFGAVAFFIFIAGFIYYLAHLFLESRRKGIIAMEWGVMILFVVFCLVFVFTWVN